MQATKLQKALEAESISRFGVKAVQVLVWSVEDVICGILFAVGSVHLSGLLNHFGSLPPASSAQMPMMVGGAKINPPLPPPFLLIARPHPSLRTHHHQHHQEQNHKQQQKQQQQQTARSWVEKVWGTVGLFRLIEADTVCVRQAHDLQKI